MKEKLKKWIDKERQELSKQRKIATSKSDKSEIDYIDGRMDELNLLIKEFLSEA